MTWMSGWQLSSVSNKIILLYMQFLDIKKSTRSVFPDKKTFVLASCLAAGPNERTSGCCLSTMTGPNLTSGLQFDENHNW